MHPLRRNSLSISSRINGPEHETPVNHAPERRLLAAMLERAILDLRCNTDLTKQNDARESLLWIETNSSAPFSFEWLCNELELDPTHLRRFAIKIVSGEKKVSGLSWRGKVIRKVGVSYKARKDKADVCEESRCEPKTDSTGA